MIRVFSIIFLISCGNPKAFVEYPSQSENELSLGSECPILLGSYKSTLKNLIEEKCIDCHQKPSSPDIGLVEGDDRNNYNTFLSIYNGDVSKILSKLNNETAHTGGDQINDEDERNIELFFKVNDLCTST